MTRYTYLGTRGTRPELVGLQCDPVRDARGKCIRWPGNGVALVVDARGRRHVVVARRLRLNSKLRGESSEKAVGA